MRVRHELLVIPGLKPSLEGYTILHVSDIHFNRSVAMNATLRKQLHSGEQDLVLITGDFVTHDRETSSLIEFLKGSTAKDGIYGILGNHDYSYRTFGQHFLHKIANRQYRPNDWKRMVALLSEIGIRVLVNESLVLVTRGGGQIYLEGTDDPVLGTPVIADQNSEFANSDLKILMSHSPDILYSDQIKKKEFDLVLSGHTHGGQVRIPGIGPLVTGTERASRQESYGMFAKGKMRVNVSAGIGYSNLPIRVNCPPEVILIELSGSPC